MPRTFEGVPSDELSRKIAIATNNIRNKTSRQIRCHYCKRIAFEVYADSTGYIETKCSKCGKPILIDLVSMRRMRRK